MSYSFYLAASWGRKEEISRYAQQLRDAGFGVTSTWFDEQPGPHSSEGDYDPSYLREIAVRDVEEIEAADGLIFFANDYFVPTKGGGRHFELGYAYSEELDIYVVGGAEHVFCHLPEIEHYDLFEDLYADLTEDEIETPLEISIHVDLPRGLHWSNGRINYGSWATNFPYGFFPVRSEWTS